MTAIVDRAAPADPVSAMAREVTEAVAQVVNLWERADQATFPRLSSLQLRALTAARRTPGINLTRLAREVRAGAPAASRLCDRLEAAGMLRRQRSADSRREVGLILTHQGQGTVDGLYERRSQALHHVLSGMRLDQRRHLLDGLRALTEAINTPPGPDGE
ncbi:MarR family winged helix-turn-helix transcriptional regulator [Streptomyces sp. NPDC054797]